MKIRLLLIISLFSISVLSADEFIEPGTSLGGYGELHWDHENGEMDFHRFILFVNHVWDDKWSFKSEIEIEHNIVKSSGSGGYMALEQAYVNYNGGNWNARMGVVLAPVGLVNEMHEPPTFLSVERPSYHSYVIPTTWFDNGFGGTYSFGDWQVGLTILADLNGADMMDPTSKSGVDGAYSFKYARGKGFETMAHNLTQIVNFDYSGVDGLHIGGSMTSNDMPETVVDNKVTKYVGMDMNELHVAYNKHNVWARFETATIDFDFSKSSDNMLKKATEGNYIELGYNVGSLMPSDCNLVLWTRQSSWDANTDKNDSENVGDVSESLMGITWWPNESVSFKIESGSKDIDWNDGSAQSSSTDMMNIGIGYMF